MTLIDVNFNHFHYIGLAQIKLNPSLIKIIIIYDIDHIDTHISDLQNFQYKFVKKTPQTSTLHTQGYTALGLRHETDVVENSCSSLGRLH